MNQSLSTYDKAKHILAYTPDIDWERNVLLVRKFDYVSCSALSPSSGLLRPPSSNERRTQYRGSTVIDAQRQRASERGRDGVGSEEGHKEREREKERPLEFPIFPSPSSVCIRPISQVG